jgi:hypothetical protein
MLRIVIPRVLMGLSLLAGVGLWHRSKLGPAKLPLILLAALAVGVVLVGACFLFELGWVARTQGHF